MTALPEHTASLRQKLFRSDVKCRAIKSCAFIFHIAIHAYFCCVLLVVFSLKEWRASWATLSVKGA